MNSKHSDNSITRVCVYCGSSTGANPLYAESARELGRLLARSGIALVYGGGRIGLMNEIANAVLRLGGHVTGVIPRSLVDRELAHHGVSDLRIVDSMHERKALMADLCDAFIAMPGGIGTFEEFLEALTWSQLGFHGKPLGLLNTAGFYNGLVAFLEHAVSEGFMNPRIMKMITIGDNPLPLLEALHAYRAPDIDKAKEALMALEN